LTYARRPRSWADAISSAPGLGAGAGNLQVGAPRQGVVGVADVASALKSAIYASLQQYSRNYLSTNREYLAGYRWTVDALNHWSRVYEYVFASERIGTHVADGGRVLDAGAGVTFFPFYLSSRYEVSCLDACDYGSFYAKLNESQHTRVQFVRGMIQDLPFRTGSLDCVSCISVLEHTGRVGQALREFARVLRPGGLLVVTFDVALDGSREGLSPRVAGQFLRLAGESFALAYTPDDLGRDMYDPEVYTTYFVRCWNPDLLPWPRRSPGRFLKELMRLRIPRPLPNLAFCSISALRKRD
jgi:SAM-dependent methyltransferase